ncbi:MAG: RecQ family ATP-dependent DNA helicase [Spirochaetaceae bacterium]|nr:RecQ family ATP-dependent DNA helicase [Spirochaetaceae bacterium]
MEHVTPDGAESRAAERRAAAGPIPDEPVRAPRDTEDDESRYSIIAHRQAVSDHGGPVPAADHPVDPDPINELARRRLGISYLFPYQRLVVANLLEGRHQIVVLPTGAGKSVCFMFPAVVLEGVTLVVLPLLALLEDLYRRMTAAGLAVAVLRGGQTRAERAAVLRRVASREARLVLVTPEAALGERLLAALADTGAIEHLVVDEAHCISQWGDSFRPTYLRLNELVQALRPRVVSAFTATATPAVLKRVREVLYPDGGAHLVAGNPDRPNIRYAVAPTAGPLHCLAELVAACPRPLIVFARSRRGVEDICWQLRRRLPGMSCRFYHAGLNAAERKRLEAWFLTSRDGALIATSAYGMGVDKPDIRTVVHREMPESVEAYLQETGRAGRDGKPSQAILVWYQPAAARGAGQDRRLPWQTPPTAVPASAHLAALRAAHLVIRRLRRPVRRAAAPGAEPAAEDAPGARPGSDGPASERAALSGYAANAATCRRAQLLRFFERDDVPCSGCDVCDGAVAALTVAEQEMLRALRRGSRRFTPRQWRHILAGGRSHAIEAGGLYRAPGFGLLAGWHPEEIEDACTALIAARLVRVPARGPWRGLLVTVRRPRPTPAPVAAPSTPAGGASAAGEPPPAPGPDVPMI